MDNEALTFLPVSLNITGRKILIVGGGRVGLHKATILSRFTDSAVVVSTRFEQGFEKLPFTLIRKEYQPADLEGCFLVYVCTENERLNSQVKTDAGRVGVLASVCDSPAQCDFISPAIYGHENVTVAVSSNARNVRQSIRVRDRIAALHTDKSLDLD